MISLKDLSSELKAIVPVGGLLSLHRQIVKDVNPGDMVNFEFAPEIGTVKIQLANGESVADSDYDVDYIHYRFSLDEVKYPDIQSLIVTYKKDTSTDYVTRAVRDLGQRLPQRAVAHVRIGTNGYGDLPDTFQSIIELSEIVECDETDPGCGGTTTSSCSQSGDCYECSYCRTFVRGDKLVVHPLPPQAFSVEICYLGGFPLNSRGYFEGLSREFADIAILRATAIAYRSPQMTEYAISSGGSSITISGESSGDLIELSHEAGDQRTTQRWESASKSFFDRSKTLTSTADTYDREYERRIWAIQGISKVGTRKGGFRDKQQRWL